MTKLSFRQGTIYEDKQTGERLLVINHNPMNLQSLIFHSPHPEASFNLAAPEIISIDTLISIRKSGQFKDLGDLPKEAAEKIIEILISKHFLQEQDQECLKNLLKEIKSS